MDVVIANDVWIGRNATIISGVKIGSGAVIATEAMVTKDVPPYGIVGGNPAKLIRYRFSENIRARLLKLAWWKWTPEKIKTAIPLLMQENIELYLETYEGSR